MGDSMTMWMCGMYWPSPSSSTHPCSPPCLPHTPPRRRMRRMPRRRHRPPAKRRHPSGALGLHMRAFPPDGRPSPCPCRPAQSPSFPLVSLRHLTQPCSHSTWLTQQSGLSVCHRVLERSEQRAELLRHLALLRQCLRPLRELTTPRIACRGGCGDRRRRRRRHPLAGRVVSRRGRRPQSTHPEIIGHEGPRGGGSVTNSSVCSAQWVGRGRSVRPPSGCLADRRLK
mmetsp:Transcript_51854/g.103177  ORF Transcript_51854/g.103177 Transcript_51854/m.103177 type:complete len:227 (+) Transcript_51854:147-827(+)